MDVAEIHIHVAIMVGRCRRRIARHITASMLLLELLLPLVIDALTNHRSLRWDGSWCSGCLKKLGLKLTYTVLAG
eukprot:9869991-Prorocentrum_lima.AAC.1